MTGGALRSLRVVLGQNLGNGKRQGNGPTKGIEDGNLPGNI